MNARRAGNGTCKRMDACTYAASFSGVDESDGDADDDDDEDEDSVDVDIVGVLTYVWTGLNVAIEYADRVDELGVVAALTIGLVATSAVCTASMPFT